MFVFQAKYVFKQSAASSDQRMLWNKVIFFNNFTYIFGVLHMEDKHYILALFSTLRASCGPDSDRYL